MQLSKIHVVTVCFHINKKIQRAKPSFWLSSKLTLPVSWDQIENLVFIFLKFFFFCQVQFLIQLQLKVEHLQVYRKQHKITSFFSTDIDQQWLSIHWHVFFFSSLFLNSTVAGKQGDGQTGHRNTRTELSKATLAWQASLFGLQGSVVYWSRQKLSIRLPWSRVSVFFIIYF